METKIINDSNQMKNVSNNTEMNNSDTNSNTLMRICIGKSVEDPKDTHPCTVTEFVAASKSAQVEAICRELKSLTPDDTADRRAKLKAQLPVFCFSASHFDNDYRNNKNAHPSGLCMIDWDKVTDTQEWLSAFGQDREQQVTQLRLCGLVGFHLSASGHGFHGIIKMREGETILEAQARVARHMGKEDYDRQPHAVSQSSYIVPYYYWLFVDMPELMAQPETTTLPQAPRNADIEEAEVLSEVTDDEQTDTYDGVPMKLLVNTIIFELMHLEAAPAVGTRNNRYLELQRHLRYLCDFDVEKMLRVAPAWGLGEQERRSACQSAAKYERVPGLPRALNDLITQLKGQMKLAEGFSIDTRNREPLPQDMPKLLMLIFKLLPECVREAAFFCAMPLLGTLTTALRYKHNEVKTETTSFQVYMRGHMSCGKGFMSVLNEMLLKPIDQDDERLMTRENTWREEWMAAGTGKKKREQHNVIRRVQADFTLPALRKQLFNARKQHLLIFSEESDVIQMSRELSSILRNAYDASKTGQTRVSPQSVNGMAVTLINTLLSGTPDSLKRFLPNAEDGLVSRHILFDLPDRLGEDEPVYNHLTAREYHEIDKEVMRLHNIGLLEDVQQLPDYQPEHTEVWIKALPRTEEFIKSWSAARKLEFFTSGCKNVALEKFSRRITTHIRRISMVLWALEKGRETDRSMTLLRWAADRMLTEVLDIYGNQYEEIYRKSNAARSPYKRHSKNADLLSLLPETFSLDDIVSTQQARGLACTRQNAYVIATRLKGYIEPTGEPNHWRKVTGVA